MNLSEAWHGPRGPEWIASADKEFDGLTDSGVVEHGLTLKELEGRGVKPDVRTNQVKPIPISVVLDHTYVDNILSRLKTRLAVCGDKRHMKKGIHFTETFAASPNHNTARLLQAICGTDYCSILHKRTPGPYYQKESELR